jgi:hypothetical protein
VSGGGCRRAQVGARSASGGARSHPLPSLRQQAPQSLRDLPGNNPGRLQVIPQSPSLTDQPMVWVLKTSHSPPGVFPGLHGQPVTMAVIKLGSFAR